MDINKLEVLLHAADHGSFSKTAEKMGYTQSGITHMMNSLEDEFGFPILVRSNKGVYLTEDGSRIAPFIRKLLNMNEQLQQECALIQGIERGLIRIGSYTSLSIMWLPQIIEQFSKQHPGIAIDLVQGEGPELESWLSDRRVDLIFYSLSNESGFQNIALHKDPFQVAMPKGHSMESQTVFPIKSFENSAFLIYNLVREHDANIKGFFKKHDVHPNIRFSSNSEQYIIAMIEHHQGISVLPELVLKKWGSNLICRPLHPNMSRTLGIALRSMQFASPATRKFIEYAKEVLNESPIS